MKTILLSIFVILTIGCSNSATWDKSFDPLDAPMYRQPTVEDYHKKNVGLITGNPAIRYDVPVELW